MEEKDFIEPNEETRARGVKQSSDIKIAEVTTSKKKRPKKARAAILALTLKIPIKLRFLNNPRPRHGEEALPAII